MINVCSWANPPRWSRFADAVPSGPWVAQCIAVYLSMVNMGCAAAVATPEYWLRRPRASNARSDDCRKYCVRKEATVLWWRWSLVMQRVCECSYGMDPPPSRDEIMAAARDANAHDFISALPDAYDTLVCVHSPDSVICACATRRALRVNAGPAGRGAWSAPVGWPATTRCHCTGTRSQTEDLAAR